MSHDNVPNGSVVRNLVVNVDLSREFVVTMRCIFIFVVYLFLNCTGLGFAALPPAVFSTISSTDGLPQNTGRAMLQDHDGFLWVGTEDGLVRFDGHSMLSFRKDHEAPNTLSDNYIDSLAEDTEGRIWVGTMGGGLNVVDEKRKDVFRLNTLSTDDIRDIAIDSEAQIVWLATGSGLYVVELTRKDGQLLPLGELQATPIPLVDKQKSLYDKTIVGITLDGDNVWFCTREDGAGRYSTVTETSEWFKKGFNGLKTDSYNTIYSAPSGGIWLGSQDKGVVQLIETGGSVSFKHFDAKAVGLGSDDVMAIAEGGEGKLWLGMWGGGLALFDIKAGTVAHYRHRGSDQYSIPSDIIMNVLTTTNGQIWLGTFDKGVSWFHPNSPFRTFRANHVAKKGLRGNLVWSFAAEKDTKLWIGSGKGLSRLNLESNEYDTPTDIQPRPLWSRVKNDDVRALMFDGEDLWIAGRKQSVHKLSLTEHTITPLSELVEENQYLTHPYVRLIYRDSRGIIWFGATKGLNRFDPATKRIRNYRTEKEAGNHSLPHYRIRAIYEDAHKRIWVGTSNGAMVLDEKGEIVRVILVGQVAQNGLRLAGKGIRGVGEDPQGRIWFATEGGISVYDENAETTTILREAEGLPSNAVYSVVFTKGFMWASTLNGLVRIDPETFEIVVYSADDGLPGNEFNFNAWLKVPGERLAYGSLSGFVIMNPEKIPGPGETEIVPPLYVTPYLYQEDGRRYVAEPSDKGIDLDWRNNKISFYFGALNYAGDKSVTYDLKLDGADKSWSSSEGQHIATFTGLTDGKYTFYVRAKDVHGQWAVESSPVSFLVEPAPWKTWSAFVFYVMLAAGLFSLGSMLHNRRLKARSVYLENLVATRTEDLKSSNQQLTESHQKLDTLLAAREKFYRAIAHELRTPLTLVLSLLESYRNDGVEKSTMLKVIEERAGRINTLLDSILNLANKTADTDTVPSGCDARGAIETALEPFRQQTDLEGKELHEDVDVCDVFLGMEEETFIIVISGLLSNACKFTEKGGNIGFSASCRDDHLIILVNDDGPGVKPEDKRRIFNWFERESGSTENGGWGIGLAFAKDEIEYAGGSLLLGRSQNRGAEFTITLPTLANKSSQSRGQQLMADNVESYRTPTLFLDEKRSFTVLIVEDDPGLLEHLPTLFPHHWDTVTCLDAERGWERAYLNEPDVIITDLMLPGESGFDFTCKLKNDDATAHIPVVILTALNSEEHRLRGLELSVDSFLGKPFKNIELQMKVAGLLENRLKTMARAQKTVLSQPAKEGFYPVDTKKAQSILEKLQEVLQSDKEVASLSLDEVARKMAMSKRSLQREMGKVGLNWSEYKKLRKIRYAMELLRNTDHNIGVVAELSGYSSTAHFGKIFKEITGKSPSAWRKSQ